MKRMSIAEQTLQGEIRKLVLEETLARSEAEAANSKANTIQTIRMHLEDEQHRLQRIREAASTSRRPAQ